MGAADYNADCRHEYPVGPHDLRYRFGQGEICCPVTVELPACLDITWQGFGSRPRFTDPLSACFAVLHLPRAKNIEVERITVFSSLVLHEGMKLCNHAFDQGQAAAGMILMRQIFKLAGVVHEVVQRNIAGSEEFVER